MRTINLKKYRQMVIFSNGQCVWREFATESAIVRIKLDFFANKLLETLDTPKQYIHLERFLDRYRGYINIKL